MDEKHAQVLASLAEAAVTSRAAPDEQHITLAVAFLMQLQPRQRPLSCEKLEGSLLRRACSDYRSMVPIEVLAATLLDVLGDIAGSKAQGLKQLAGDAKPAEKATGAWMAAARVATRWLSQGGEAGEDAAAIAVIAPATEEGGVARKTLKLSQLVTLNAWCKRSTEPAALVAALAERGAVSVADDGKVTYNEDKLASMQPKDLHAATAASYAVAARGAGEAAAAIGGKGAAPAAAAVKVAKRAAGVSEAEIVLDLGMGFLAAERVCRLRKDGGLRAVATRWIKGISDFSSLMALPLCTFSKKDAFMSFRVCPATPDLAAKLQELAQKDIETRYTPLMFKVKVSAPCVRIGPAQARYVMELQRMLKCKISADKAKLAFTVMMTHETTASEGQICEILELVFGQRSVVLVASVPLNKVGIVVGSRGANIRNLSGAKGEVKIGTKTTEIVPVFACIDPNKAFENLGSVSEAIAKYKTEQKEAPKFLAARINELIDDAIERRLIRDSAPVEEASLREKRGEDMSKCHLKDARHKANMAQHDAHKGGKGVMPHSNRGHGGLHRKPKGGKHKVQEDHDV